MSQILDEESETMKRAVLFDFDLTLADSTRGVIECINYALMKMGLPQAEDQAIRATIGLSLPATLARLTGLTDLVLAKSFTGSFVECADLRMVDLTLIFPNASRAVHELRKSGLKTGIVSTKYRYRIDAILARDRLSEHFDVIVGGEDVVRHKPDPEGLLRAIERIGTSGLDTVYVGDHPVDAMAASAAGIPFVAVLTGNAVIHDFDQWPDIQFIESLPELVPLLTTSRGSQTRN
jgi:phosphoglycolate phosphatase